MISQGLLMPWGQFPELMRLAGLDDGIEGQDVTELLGVTKYEVPVKATRLGRSVRPYGPFAADVPKTDEERLQSSPEVMAEMLGLPYVITEKCDGTSSTFAIDRDGVFRVYSRNWEIMPAKDPSWFEAACLGLVRWFALSVLFKVPQWRARANKIRIWVHNRSHRHETLYWDIARKYMIEEAFAKASDLRAAG